MGLDGFEFIQRKKDHGFGEGNFKAFFESMERDQIKWGMINLNKRWKIKSSNDSLFNSLRFWKSIIQMILP